MPKERRHAPKHAADVEGGVGAGVVIDHAAGGGRRGSARGQATAGSRRSNRGNAGVVDDLQVQDDVTFRRGDGQVDGRFASRYAVPEGVLDERLEEEAGDEAGVQVGVDGGESDLFAQRPSRCTCCRWFATRRTASPSPRIAAATWTPLAATERAKRSERRPHMAAARGGVPAATVSCSFSPMG
jgi:hypothetical protein